MVDRHGGGRGDLSEDIGIPEHADRKQGCSHGKRGKNPDQNVASEWWDRMPHVDADEQPEERNGDGEGGGHDIGQVFRFAEQPKNHGVQRKLADCQEHDQNQMKNGRKKNRDVPSQFLFPSLIRLGDGLEPDFKLFHTF